MKTIMIMPVSEQTLPNVLLIKQIPKINKYFFIVTKKMKSLHKVAHIIKATNIAESKTEEILVSEESFIDIISKLEKRFGNASNFEYIVNITCGTKIMSLALFEFFKNQRSKIYYIPPNKNIYRQIYPEIENKENNITVFLNLEEYFTAYGINLENFSYPFFDYSLAVRFFKIKRDAYDNLKQGLLGHKIDEKKLKKISKIFPPETKVKKIQDYISGRWFEEYLFYNFREFLSPENIMMNIIIEKEGIKNEIDLAFIYKNHLYIVEAKTNKNFDTNTINNFIYK